MKRKTAMLLAVTMLISAYGQCAAADDGEQLLPKNTEITKTVLDWNFDTDGVSVVTSGVTAYFMQDGAYVSDGTQRLCGNIGSSANSIDIYETGITSKDNGSSLRLLSTDGAQVQCNALWSQITYDADEGNMAVYELEFAVSDFSTRKTIMNVRNNVGWGMSFELTTSGQLVFGSESADVATDTWYKVTEVYDFANHRIVALLNDEVFGTYTLSESVTATQRMTVDNGTGAAGALYVDNLKVYSMKEYVAEPTFEISADVDTGILAGYAVKLETTVRDYDDAKTVRISVSADGTEYEYETETAAESGEIYITPKYKTTFVKAELCDGEENVLAESEVTLETVQLEETGTLQDVILKPQPSTSAAARGSSFIRTARPLPIPSAERGG